MEIDDNDRIELHDGIKDVIDEIVGQDAPFVVVLPDRQIVLTNCQQQTVAAACSQLVTSYVMGSQVVVREGSDGLDS